MISAIFPSTQAITKDIFDIYIDISQGTYQKQTYYIQNKWEQELQFGFDNNQKTEYQDDKKNMLPCVVFSGCYDRYKSIEEQTAVQHSGRMNMDIDMNNRIELDEFNKVVLSGRIPFIEACGKSVSGKFNGSMWINVLIELPESYNHLTEYIIDKLKLKEDNYISKIHTTYYEFFSDLLYKELKIVAGNTKEVKRLRYLSHDSNIFINYEAKYLDL